MQKDDLISRQAAIDAVNNERCEHGMIKDILCDKILISAKDRIRRLPSAQPTQTDTSNTLKALDCVERQAAIDCLCNGKCTEEGRWCDDGDCMPVRRINSLPSAEPEQRWRPCSEKLPEGTVIVTVETKFKHKYVCEAVWIPRWTWKAEYDNWEDCTEYNEDEDEYYVLEGWYERVYNWDEYSYVAIEDDVIAWMPLPEPYTERREE